jgi:pyrroline-5-carboxylate reductase
MAVRLAIVGGGNMGTALAGGLVASAWAPAGELLVVEPLEGRRAALATELPGVGVTDALDRTADGAVIAVKPGDVPAAAEAIARAGIRRVLSIAAGVRTTAVETALDTDAAVVRAMPNTPALVRAGVAAIAAGRHAGAADLDWAESILGAVGTVVRVPEADLDAVTGLSGSGPAYLFLVAEALIDAGVAVGLARDVSVALTTQLLVGSAALLAQSGAPPEVLRQRVTSPGGTTAAGLRVLDAAGVSDALRRAVIAATERSRELGAP